MNTKRYKIDTNGRDILAIAIGLASSNLSLPFNVIYGIVSTLMGLSSIYTTEYVETITYYCDTPSPRNRYVTNYYTNSCYSKIRYTYTTEVVFQNP